MPDQIVLRRTAGHGRRAGSLASGFGGDTPIQPASVSTLRGGPATTPGVPGVPGVRGAAAATGSVAGPAPVLRRSTSAPAGTTRLPAPPPGFASGSWAPLPDGPPVPRSGQVAARVGAAPGVTAPFVPTPPAARFAGSVTSPSPTSSPMSSSPSAPAAPAARNAPSTSLLRRLTVAPPRVSVNPAASAAPPVPDVVRRSPSTSTPSSSSSSSSPVARSGSTPPAGGVAPASSGGSLFERSAHLFDALDDAASAVIHRKYEPGRSAMGESSLVPASVSASSAAGAFIPGVVDDPVTRDEPHTAESDRARFDRLVDAVVDRIEQRVIDELERRGRRQDWKVF